MMYRYLNVFNVVYGHDRRKGLKLGCAAVFIDRQVVMGVMSCLRGQSGRT